MSASAGPPDVPAALTRLRWRRTVAELYERVRTTAGTDPLAAHELWRTGRDELFRSSPDSPLPAGDPLRSTGLPVWPYDPALRGTSPLFDAPAGDLELAGGDDGPVRTTRIGAVELPLPGRPRVDLWRLRQYADGLFLPLRDSTAGRDPALGGSYGAGRYLLDTAKGADLGERDGELVLDLNFLYHPSCRYDPAWTCPLAQPGNRVDVAVEAGERMPVPGAASTG